MARKRNKLIAEKQILSTIMIVRGEKVILDSDLAALYGVETRRLNEQVRRNIHKFPDDFMFQLTKDEFDNLKSQIATSTSGWGGRRKPPLVFTEHGALQAANVLSSQQAIKMSVFIVRAFVRLRKMVLTNEKLSKKFAQLEKRVSNSEYEVEKFKKYYSVSYPLFADADSSIARSLKIEGTPTFIAVKNNTSDRPMRISTEPGGLGDISQYIKKIFSHTEPQSQWHQ
jgi:hypothetical protein